MHAATESQRETPATDQHERTTEEEEQEHYWDYCPNCGHRLYNHGCKYRCPTCHYFMSCSDFD